MKLHISASNSIIGNMLAQEDDDNVERDIYYLSRLQNDAETRYILIEKLIFFFAFLFHKVNYIYILKHLTFSMSKS